MYEDEVRSMCRHIFIHRYNVVSKDEEYECINCGYKLSFKNTQRREGRKK